MRRILFIDDDNAFRHAMMRVFAAEQDFSVSDAASLDEGLLALDRDRPELIVSDLDMPGRLGCEILGELGKRGLSVPVIFLSGYARAFSAQIPRHRDVELREKPIDAAVLVGLMRERLARTPEEQPAAPFSAADYLQLACIGGHSVEIALHRGAEAVGNIIVHRGEAWSATDQASAGTEAFRHLVFAQGARVDCRSLVGPVPERNLMGKWEALLLDAARESDEDRPRGDDGFGRLLDQALDAMLRKDYAGALKAYVAARALRADDPTVTANIRRLHELGVSEEGT